MSSSGFDGKLNAEALRVGRSLDMSSKDKDEAGFKDVKLNSANIAGDVDLSGASFDGQLDATALRVDGTLDMISKDKYKARFKDVKLSSAKIGGNVQMFGISFVGGLDANALQVGGNLSIGNDSSFKDVRLAGAKISGFVDMSNASFDGKLDAYGIQVGGYLSMQNACCAADKVIMAFAKFGNNLNLRDATLADLDLSGASIAMDLQLGSQNNLANWKPKDGQDGNLNLRNAHIGNLMDTKKAWPKKHHLVLNGATFDHLGGSEGETEHEMLKRGADWWVENWAELNPQYSPSPYAQLAAAFTAMGDRDNTNEIRYRAREHERHLAWDDRDWFTWVFLSALNYVAGYGIGRHTFRVAWWVVGFLVAGAALLWLTVPAARTPHKGLLWCLGASLARLLPVIEINKEFTDFFNDPDRLRLNQWQAIMFSALGIIGWLLGAVLVVAFSSLTQSS